MNIPEREVVLAFTAHRGDSQDGGAAIARPDHALQVTARAEQEGTGASLIMAALRPAGEGVRA